MKCTVCGSEMKLVQKDSSFREDEKEYDKATYNCSQDDIWIVVETPKNRPN